MTQSQITLRASAARYVEDIPVAMCGGLFPLTPALSLGERVNPSHKPDLSAFTARCALFPLPEGEGQGERKRRARPARRRLAVVRRQEFEIFRNCALR